MPKKYFIFLFIFLICVGQAMAYRFFYEDWESGSISTNNWTTSGAGVPWAIQTANPFEGTYHIEASNTDGLSYIESTIDTTGYENISLEILAETYGLDAGEYFIIEWHNGTDYIELLNIEDIALYTKYNYNLTGASDNISVRFTCYSTGNGEECRVDPVSMYGDPISPPITIYQDNFEGNNLTSEWSVNGTGAQWASSTVAPYEGTYHAAATNIGAGNPTYMAKNISTEGYYQIVLIYNRQLVGLDAVDYFDVEWFDGTGWTAVESLGSDTGNDEDYIYKQYELPAGAENNPNFALRMMCDNGAVSESCYVDDIYLLGSQNASAPDTVDTINDALLNYSISNISNKFSIHIQPYFDNNGTWTEVNRTLVPSTEPYFEYGVTDGIYEVHFKDSVSTTTTILLRRGIEIAYDPNGIYWDSTTDDDIIDANPGGSGDPDPGDPTSFIYPDCYVPGVDLKFTYLADELKEYLLIENRSILGDPPGTVLAGDNITFKHEFALHNVNNADLYINGTLWTETGTMDFVREAYFYYNNSIIFRLDRPYAFDSVGNEVYGWYKFRRTVGDLWVEMHIPFEWINDTSTIYPIAIDPTTVIVINDTVEISLDNPEYDPLRTVIIYNFTDNGNNTLVYDNLGHNHSEWIDEYALDPTNLDFSLGVVITKNASGDYLYKCLNWSMELQTCNGTWEKTNISIAPGQEYNFSLTPQDPGYAEYIVGPGEYTTTSEAYVNATTIIFNISRAGDYIVLITYQQRGDKLVEEYFSRVYFNGTTLAELQRTPKEIDPTKQYRTYFTHKILYLPIGEYTMHVQHKIETGAIGFTSYIKNIRMTVFDVDTFDIQDMEYVENETQYNLTTTFQNVSILDFVPQMNITYLHLASIEGNYYDTNDDLEVEWYNEDELVSRWVQQPQDVDGWYWGGFIRSMNETTEQDTFYSQARKSDAANPAAVRRSRITSVSLLDEYDPNWDYDNNTYTNNQLTYVVTKNYSFTPLYPDNEYLILVSADVTSSQAKPAVTQVLVNNTVICEAPSALKSSTDVVGLFCQTVINVSGLSEVNIQIRIRSTQNNKQVEIKRQSISAFSFIPTMENDLICYPELNQDWIIDEPIICNNVTRTTGTGKIIIREPGSLELINNANITSTGIIIERWSNPYMARMERGSQLLVKR